MVDVAHVRLVDAHPERDRRDDDPAIQRLPPLLHLGAELGCEPGVVGARRQPRVLEQRSDPLCIALQGHVHDRRPGRASAEALEQERIASRGCDGRLQQLEVLAVEARDDRVVRIDPERLLDVGLHLGRRRGRQGEQPLRTELTCARDDLQVVGTERVTP